MIIKAIKYHLFCKKRWKGEFCEPCDKHDKEGKNPNDEIWTQGRGFHKRKGK